MSDANQATVRKFLGLFNAIKPDVEGLKSCLAPDARYQALVPLAKKMHGADKICAEIARQYDIYVECECNILHIASVGDTVFTERVDTVRQLSDDRKPVTHVAGVFDMDDQHRITFWREYWDGLAVADQMGVPADTLKAIMTAG
jgi:limonene-1,2-epoxide hydrolase